MSARTGRWSCYWPSQEKDKASLTGSETCVRTCLVLRCLNLQVNLHTLLLICGFPAPFLSPVQFTWLSWRKQVSRWDTYEKKEARGRRGRMGVEEKSGHPPHSCTDSLWKPHCTFPVLPTTWCLLTVRWVLFLFRHTNKKDFVLRILWTLQISGRRWQSPYLTYPTS